MDRLASAAYRGATRRKFGRIYQRFWFARRCGLHLQSEWFALNWAMRIPGWNSLAAE
jgi:hypothetical protein